MRNKKGFTYLDALLAVAIFTVFTLVDIDLLNQNSRYSKQKDEMAVFKTEVTRHVESIYNLSETQLDGLSLVTLSTSPPIACVHTKSNSSTNTKNIQITCTLTSIYKNVVKTISFDKSY
jgi:competence protein ComGC